MAQLTEFFCGQENYCRWQYMYGFLSQMIFFQTENIYYIKRYHLVWRFSGFNTEEALKKAKDNVEKHYSVVGVLEEFNKTLEVFEHYIPNFFKGSMNVFWSKA